MPFLGSFVKPAEDASGAQGITPSRSSAPTIEEKRIDANDVNEDLLPENSQPFPGGPIFPGDKSGFV